MQRFILSEQLLEEEKEELTSSKGLETSFPNALFYQYCGLGCIYLKRRKETDSKAIYDRVLIHRLTLQGVVFHHFSVILLLPEIAIIF